MRKLSLNVVEPRVETRQPGLPNIVPVNEILDTQYLCGGFFSHSLGDSDEQLGLEMPIPSGKCCHTDPQRTLNLPTEALPGPISSE